MVTNCCACSIKVDEDEAVRCSNCRKHFCPENIDCGFTHGEASDVCRPCLKAEEEAQAANDALIAAAQEEAQAKHTGKLTDWDRCDNEACCPTSGPCCVCGEIGPSGICEGCIPDPADAVPTFRGCASTYGRDDGRGPF